MKLDQNKTMEANAAKISKKKQRKKSQIDQDDSSCCQFEEDEKRKTLAALNQLDRQFIYIQVIATKIKLKKKSKLIMIVSFSKKMEYCGGKTLKYLIENGLYKLVRILELYSEFYSEFYNFRTI